MSISFDLVILIDCWELESEWGQEQVNFETRTPEFYSRIVKKLSNYNFKNVVLASHNKWDLEDLIPDTSKWLVDNIQSKNNGFDLKFRKCENIIEVFREFPEALHTGLDFNNEPNTLRVLICGQAFRVCTHHRPLGFIGWLEQEQNGIFTHPDLVFIPNLPWLTKQDFEDDTVILWDMLEENSYTSKLLDDKYPASANIMHAAGLTALQVTEK
jgi:hypothetical protein